jgi:hypothetical protein
MSFQAMTWAVKAKLPSREKFLLIMMANYADDTGKCWPSVTTLMNDTGFCRRTVMNSIKTLSDMGALKVQNRTFQGKKISNVYRLNTGWESALDPPC